MRQTLREKSNTYDSSESCSQREDTTLGNNSQQLLDMTDMTDLLNQAAQ